MKQEDCPVHDILQAIKQNLHSVCPPADQDMEYFQRTGSNYYVPWEIPLCPDEKISPKKKNEDLLGTLLYLLNLSFYFDKHGPQGGQDLVVKL